MLVFSSRDKHCRGNCTSFRLFDRARSLKASNAREARDFFTGEKFQNLVRRRFLRRQNLRAVSNFRVLSRLCYYFVKKLFDKLHWKVSQ